MLSFKWLGANGGQIMFFFKWLGVSWVRSPNHFVYRPVVI